MTARHTFVSTVRGMIPCPPKFNKATWTKFAKTAWGWDAGFAGRQYDAYKSGDRSGNLHDNTILLIDQNGW